MDFVKVSVVVPCYCCVDTIDRAVASIAQQSRRPAEVILVDDASPDEGVTLDKLNSLQDEYSDVLNIQIIALRENGGPSAARNAGWSAANQPYIAFLDADDSWHPEKLRIQYGYMKKHPDVVLSGHQCIEHQKEGVEEDVSCSVQKKISPTSLLFRNAFSTPTVMIKRDVPFRFNLGKRYIEDLLLWQQIAFSGLTIKRLECTLAYMHKPAYGTAGLSSRMWSMEKGELENFNILYKGNQISLVLYGSAIVFSLIKFLKRMMVMIIRKNI